MYRGFVLLSCANLHCLVNSPVRESAVSVACCSHLHRQLLQQLVARLHKAYICSVQAAISALDCSIAHGSLHNCLAVRIVSLLVDVLQQPAGGLVVPQMQDSLL